MTSKDYALKRWYSGIQRHVAALMMEAVCTFEMSVNFNETTQHYISTAIIFILTSMRTWIVTHALQVHSRVISITTIPFIIWQPKPYGNLRYLLQQWLLASTTEPMPHAKEETTLWSELIQYFPLSHCHKSILKRSVCYGLKQRDEIPVL
jgi:hypothetical protein